MCCCNWQGKGNAFPNAICISVFIISVLRYWHRIFLGRKQFMPLLMTTHTINDHTGGHSCCKLSSEALRSWKLTNRISSLRPGQEKCIFTPRGKLLKEPECLLKMWWAPSVPATHHKYLTKHELILRWIFVEVSKILRIRHLNAAPISGSCHFCVDCGRQCVERSLPKLTF